MVHVESDANILVPRVGNKRYVHVGPSYRNIEPILRARRTKRRELTRVLKRLANLGPKFKLELSCWRRGFTGTGGFLDDLVRPADDLKPRCRTGVAYLPSLKLDTVKLEVTLC